MMLLRDFEQKDAAAIVKHANNINVSRYLTSRFPFPYTGKDAEWWLTVGHLNGLNKAIVVDGECIGGIGIVFGQDEHIYTKLSL